MSYGKIDISADEENLRLLFQNQVIYTIPKYQRSYSWGKEQWGDLYNDIKEGLKHDRIHLLGEVKIVPKNGQDPTRYEIVDGQQRITTAAVILCALRDEYEKRRGSDDKFTEQLQEHIQTKDMNANKLRSLRLLEAYDDDKVYEKIYNKDGSSLDSTHPIARCYRWFKNHFEKQKLERLSQIRKYLMEGLSFITTKVDDPNQAFIIFETQNRGLDLQPLERAKAVVMRIAHRRADDDLRNIQRVWLEIRNLCEEAHKTTPTKPIKHTLIAHPAVGQSTGYLRGDGDIVEMLRTFLEEKDRTVSESLFFLKTELELYEKIKSGKIKRYKDSQNRLFNSFARQTCIKNGYGALLLYWMVKNCDNDAEVIQAAKSFSDLNLRLKLSSATSNTTRDATITTFRSLVKGRGHRAAVSSSLREYTPSDDALKVQLRDETFPRNKSLMYILYRVESEKFNGRCTSDANVPTVGEDVEVEHIAPMGSFSHKKYSSWRSVMEHDEEKFKKVRSKLGNLTLLRSRQNQAAADEPFDQKRSKYETSEFGMSQTLAKKYDSWSYSEIEERTQKLADLAVDSLSVGSK